MDKRRRREEGVALVFATIAIVVILGALGLVMAQVQNSKRETDHAYADVVLQDAAQAGIDLAAQRLWDQYVKGSGNTTRNWASYRYYLDNELQIPKNEDLNFNGTKEPDETGNGDGVFDTYPAGYDRRGWPMLAAPVVFRDQATDRVIANIESVHIGRYDEWSQSLLTITSTASLDGKTKSAVQVLRIGGQNLPHTQFAILANNISCILCHAEFLSLNMTRNTDPNNYGTFDRIKVASLESMLVRKTEAYSNTAGTLYTRGKVYKENGSLFSASDLQGSTLKAYAFSSSNGKIQQNSSGAMTKVGLVNAGTTPSGDLTQFSNLYMNYPLDPAKQTDGAVPNGFPAPFPDENENRTVDDEEFEVIVNSANGRLQFEFASEEGESTGSINAGVAYGVPKGSVYTPGADGPLPTVSNSALSSLSATGAYEGNLILIGTEDDPINIDKTVAVDGDVMIAGKIKGYGQLLARGNVYVVGDVTYADAPGEFGVDEEGNENAFALVAGGSIMMGDYLTVRGVNHSALNNDKFPDWSKYSISTRDKNKTNTVTAGGTTQTLKWGYFDQWSVDAGQKVTGLPTSGGRPGQQFSFTTSELKLFNTMELEKALDDPGYTPRFYGLRSSQPNNIYIYDAGDEHAVRYDDAGVKKLSDYLIAKGLPLSILDRAVYQYCSPEQNWIGEDALRQIWYNDEMTRPTAGRPFLFDGLLYSNNSIWCIVRSKTRHKSNTNGSMTVRGGIIAADLGVFVPGNGSTVGLNMYYDPRVERFLEITDTSVVTFSRMAFYYAPGGTA